MSLLELEAPSTDRDLLDRYVQERDESAFAELVDRHAGHVRRVCRGVLNDDHAVDEICQDTFLLLARKSAIIPWQQSVTNWLGAVAYRLAHKRRCASARRRQREASVEFDAAESCCPLDGMAERERNGVLDHELNSLPRHYREPLVLCYLEGKTNRQAADELGWPAGSMARRLARARQILQRKLVVRGFVVASLFLVVGLLASIILRPAQDVRALMALFRPSETRPDYETMLAQLAAGDADTNPDLLALTRQTIELADQLKGRGSRDWDALNDQMRVSAVALASALEANDEAGAIVAAGQLRNTCTQCHQAFRDERRPVANQRITPVTRRECEPAVAITHPVPRQEIELAVACWERERMVACATPVADAPGSPACARVPHTTLLPAPLTHAWKHRAHPLTPPASIMT